MGVIVKSDENNRKQIREMYRLSFLTMAASLTIGVMGSIVDGVIIGRFLGPSALASYGLVSPVSGLMMLLGSFVVSGASLLCVQFMSRADTKTASGVFSLNLVIGFAIAFVFTVFVFLFSAPLVKFLGASRGASNLLEEAQGYVKGLSFGFVFSMGSMVLHPYLNLEGDRKRTVAAVFVSLIVNVVSDLVCIFILDTNLFGIAIATVLSQIAGFLISLGHFFRKQSMFRFHLKNIPWELAGKLLSGGLPMAVNRLCSIVKAVLMNRLILMIAGTSALSALSVMNNLYNIICIASLASAMSMMTNAGILVGEHNQTSMKILLTTGLKSVTLVNLPIAVIVYCFARFFAGIYAEGNTEVIGYSVTGLRFLAVSLVFLAIAQTYICFLLGTLRKALTILYMILHNLVLPIGSALTLGMLLGLNGFWASFPVCECLMLAVFFAVTFFMSGKIPKTPADYMLLPDDFYIPEEKQLEWSLQDRESAVKASEKAFTFLRTQGVDQRRCMIAALSIEEMTRNILEHGKRKKGETLIYERLLITGEGTVALRIRDNGPPFNPEHWLELYDKKDPAGNIGIRMISSMAEDFRYVNTVGMNTLIIEL